MAFDPLPTWTEGPLKRSIIDFVARVTTKGGPAFVPVDDRIAVFDDDGTLWVEQPFQVEQYFLMDRLEELCSGDPTLADRQPYKPFIDRDRNAIAALGKRGANEVLAATHAGLAPDEVTRIVADWLPYARHPKLDIMFKECIYQPQIELLRLLRTNGFKTLIVSDNGLEFVRAFSGELFGVPAEHVIATSTKTKLGEVAGRLELIKTPEIESYNDRDAKVSNIGLHLGKRPVFAFGNADGDLAMLRYTKAGDAEGRMALLLHHDDDEREFAYDRSFAASPLGEGLDRAAEYGIWVVSMKHHWKRIFLKSPPLPARTRAQAVEQAQPAP